MDRRKLLKVLGAGGCCAAAAWAGRALYHAPNETVEPVVPAGPRVPLGFFDVDSRELNASGDGLSFRERVAPIEPQLQRLYSLAEARRAPLVFTACCSGRMLRPDSLPQVLQVPIDASQRQWEPRLSAHRLFYLEKNRDYNTFNYNRNAARLLQALNVEEWVVFGNGFDMCIDTGVRGMLAAGQKVCFLSDVYVRGAPGYVVTTPKGTFHTATPENKARILADFQELGVRLLTLEQFLKYTA